MYFSQHSPFFLLLRILASLSLLCLGLVPAAAAQAPGRSASVPILGQSYLLTPGDVLEIAVQGHDDFRATTTISPDGTISYVGVGTVTAAGLTREQLTRLLAQRLVRQILHPQVTVSVQQTHPRQISMLGQGVHTPGLYEWRPGMTLLDAIAAAQGAIQAPELTDALLISHRTSQVDPINLVKLIEQGDQTQNLPLQPGDIILMSPRDPAKAYAQVVGQVGHPGPQVVPAGGATLQSVLTQAGGATATAALSHVQLVHAGQTQTLNLHNTLYNVNDPAAQVKVVAGDVINVPLNNNHVDFYGEITVPGEQLLPDGEPLYLTRALAIRGGPTREADQKAVAVVRTDSMGHQVAYVVNEEDQLKARNKKQDIVLLPDDKILLVKRRPGVNGLGALQTTLGTIFPLAALRTIFH